MGCDAGGKLIALEIDLYSNGGNSLDLTAAVMDRALMHIDCVYKCPNTKVVGYCCRTNHASNTAFRGFGGPQVCPTSRLQPSPQQRAVLVVSRMPLAVCGSAFDRFGEF